MSDTLYCTLMTEALVTRPRANHLHRNDKNLFISRKYVTALVAPQTPSHQDLL